MLKRQMQMSKYPRLYRAEAHNREDKSFVIFFRAFQHEIEACAHEELEQVLELRTSLKKVGPWGIRNTEPYHS
jgi:hypothetical protein